MITTEPFVIESPAGRERPWRILAGGDRTGGAVAFTPSGLEGMFAEQADYFATLTGEPDVPALHALSARYGVLPVEGPPLVPIPRS